ncbi:hypothetical protein KR093_010417 [Drosophila rubida]|uniref:Uncharacterized protein n=1 Tax=Drosophila rubida TaxID=30044 RepID=A0AAD4PIY5_9MUSC|nr:hypothetical protein KR093_010417 [Drosophila rubida]
MDPAELLHQLYLNVLQILKIYVKFAFITLIVYFVAEWYIVRYGAELEAQLDAQLADNDHPASNSTWGKVIRVVLNFFVI